MTARRQSGFTLVELLAVISLTLLLLGLGAAAVRHYWLVHSLDGAASSLVSEIRAQQQKAAAKSYPYAQAVWFVPGTPRWGTAEVNVKTSACTKTSDRTFEGAVKTSAASFTSVAPTAECRTALGAATAEVAIFYPGGTATPGTVSLGSSQTDSTPKTLTVSGLTGRVTQ